MRPEDREGFERLYRLHRPEIFRFLLRETGNAADADDMTQEAFLSALGAIERNGPPENPRPWLYAIAENRRRRWYRRRRERPLVALEGAGEQEAPEAGVGVAEVAEALDALPERQAQVLVGREVAGLSYAELAERLGLSTAAVQMLLFRARRAFRQELESRRGGLALLPLLRLPDAAVRVAALAGAAVVGTATLAGGSSTARARPLHPSPRAVVGHAAPQRRISTVTVSHRVRIPLARAARGAHGQPASADTEASAVVAPAAPVPHVAGNTTPETAGGTTTAATTVEPAASSLEPAAVVASLDTSSVLASLTGAVAVTTAEAPSLPVAPPLPPQIPVAVPVVGR